MPTGLSVQLFVLKLFLLGNVTVHSRTRNSSTQWSEIQFGNSVLCEIKKSFRGRSCALTEVGGNGRHGPSQNTFGFPKDSNLAAGGRDLQYILCPPPTDNSDTSLRIHKR